MKEYYLILIFIYLSYYYNTIEAQLKCDQKYDYKPCDCFPITGQIQCIGNNVTEEVLKKISDNLVNDSSKTVNLILIRDTKVTKIDNLFTQIEFKKIFIEQNKNLTQINSTSFKKGSLRSLVIRDNPALSGPTIFELARNLQPNETIEFDNNSLTSIPDSALVPNNGSLSHSLQHIILDHNKITEIGNNSFNSLPNLKIISLNNNLISKIKENGLKFGNKTNATILLNNNQLTFDQFLPLNKIIDGITQLDIHLENNTIHDFPESIFRKLLESEKVNFFLNENDFICKNCTLGWLFNLTEAVSQHYNSIYCNSTNEKDPIKVPITQLDKEDICKNW